jgi:alpha/beta superfamily hydrolase
MMNKQYRQIHPAGGAGLMECLLDLPAEAPRGIALVAHPHPLYGGTMDNKVAADTGAHLRRARLRGGALQFPRRRRLGRRARPRPWRNGRHADHASNTCKPAYPGLPVALSGFSFGTFVQAQLQQRLQAAGTPAERLVLVGTAAGKWPMPGQCLPTPS